MKLKLRNKKGDIAIQTIVMAGLALFALVILMWLVGTKLGWFGAELTKCPGKCLTSTTSPALVNGDCPAELPLNWGNRSEDCKSSGQRCCGKSPIG